MMDEQSQLKLQAYLDGELRPSECREVEDWLVHDAEAVALLAELRQTNAAMATFESQIEVPESREFYWSKIEREIQRQHRVGTVRTGDSLIARWRRLLVPAGAVAAVVAAGLLAVLQMAGGPTSESEMALADTEAFTYRDFDKGMTLVWLSYPADGDFSDFESYYMLD